MASFNTRADASEAAPLLFRPKSQGRRAWLRDPRLPLFLNWRPHFGALRQRERDKVELGRMSHYELHDIHVSSSDRWAEISKPFWRK